MFYEKGEIYFTAITVKFLLNVSVLFNPDCQIKCNLLSERIENRIEKCKPTEENFEHSYKNHCQIYPYSGNLCHFSMFLLLSVLPSIKIFLKTIMSEITCQKVCLDPFQIDQLKYLTRNEIHELLLISDG